MRCQVGKQLGEEVDGAATLFDGLETNDGAAVAVVGGGTQLRWVAAVECWRWKMGECGLDWANKAVPRWAGAKKSKEMKISLEKGGWAEWHLGQTSLLCYWADMLHRPIGQLGRG
jgi:hypothetical protein